MMFFASRRVHGIAAIRLATSAALGLLLAGCASLPSSGPTARQVMAQHGQPEALGFKVFEIEGPDLPPPEVNPAMNAEVLQTLARDGRVDQVGPGDVLQINIFEVGTTLFTNNAASMSGFDPSARDQAISGVVVDREGMIRLPYIGALKVAGRTTNQVEKMIERGLAGKSQMPQAVVTIRQNITNTVLVSGTVARPGRQSLTLGRERLLDAIAAAGGPGEKDAPQSTLVRFTRGGRSAEVYLETIASGSAADLVLLPGDRIDLVRRPRTFTVFGATNKVSQIPFESSFLSLGEAVARVGGPEDSRADPTAIFVFRYETASDGRPAAEPVIYRLNLMKPSSYFLAQRFAMRDKDVIYIANSRTNQARKMVEIINQLFSPFFLVRQATR